MKPAELLLELVYPLRNLTVVLAIVTFGILLTVSILIMQLNPIAGVAGSFLALFLLVAMFRYGMSVLEARANGKDPEVADIEVFGFFNNLWSMFPVVLLFPVSWLGVYLGAEIGGFAAVLFVGVFIALFPASLAILAITHSPLESVNPAAVARMIRACGQGYPVVPAVVLVVFLVSNFLSTKGIPLLIDVFVDMYMVFLLFTLTGAMAARAGVATQIDVGAPMEPSDSEVRSATSADREKVANHAYAFISRGNRDGGFNHIRDWIKRDPDPDEAVGWFFNAMMKWESTDAALFFAQDCFSHYLHHDMDPEALKLIAACLHENPRWRPGPGDREQAIELAERYGREDLLKSLRD